MEEPARAREKPFDVKIFFFFDGIYSLILEKIYGENVDFTKKAFIFHINCDIIFRKKAGRNLCLRC